MAIISRIENALLQIDGALFQELCNRYLYYIYNPNSINPVGSVIGKEKTRKGTPDTFFVNPEGKFTFIEYTTKERLGNSKSFFKKIKDDVLKCFDEEKTRIKPDDISKVIICHTDKLTAAEVKELINICYSYNWQCVFEQYGISDLAYGLLNYPGLIETYLDIKIGTGQLMTPSEFIDYYENRELKLTTPISNQFLGREEELKQGLKKLCENNILIISGKSGVGKSRYALEICNLFSNSDPSYKLLCIGNKGISLYEDIHALLPDSQNYLFLVDDANRIASHLDILLYLLKEKRKHQVKIVITVRDYAFNKISDRLFEFKSENILLHNLKDEVITDIIKSFGIGNTFYIEKIINISRGNARIAVMCVILVKHKQSLDSLDNISQLYEIYFSDSYNQIKETDSKNALKVLGVISFFRTISKDNIDTNARIFSVFKIEEEIFWETCYRLNEKEFVDLFDNQVVKISDQILSTYLFYKVFFDSKILDFVNLVRYFIDFEANFYDSIEPLISAFDYNNIQNELKAILMDYWPNLKQKANHETMMKVISIFWFCCEVQSLSYLKEYIDGLPTVESERYILDYDQNKMSLKIHRKDPLTILSQFKITSDNLFLSSLELMFSYIKKKPHEAGYLVYLLKENYNFEKENFLYGDYIQHSLFDFLIDHISKEGFQSVFSQFFLAIAPTFLKTHITSIKSSGTKFKIYNFCLPASQSIKELRAKIWNTIHQLYLYYKDQIYHILMVVEFPREDEAKKIWKFDSSIVLSQVITGFDFNDFKACESVNRYLDSLDYSKISYEKQFRQKATNRIYKLSKLFTREYSEKDWEKDEKLRRQKLFDYCKNFDFNAYVDLFNDISTIDSQSFIKHDYSASLSLIIADIAIKDTELYLKFLGYAIQNYNFNYSTVPIINAYFEKNPDDYKPLLVCLEDNIHSNNKNWITHFYRLLPDHFIKNDYKYLITYFFNEIVLCEKNLWCLEQILSNYGEYLSLKELHVTAIHILYNRINIDNTIIDIGIDFFDHSFNHSVDIFEKYCQLYYHCRMNSQHYDYSNDILKKIIEYNPEEIVNFFKTVYKNIHSVRDLDGEHLEFIWQLDNYEEILILSIDYFLSLDCWNNDELVKVFFTNLGKNEDKAYQFMKKQIKRHYDNRNYMHMVFIVVSSCLGKYKCEYIKQYLKLNPDIESFKYLELFPMSWSIIGSAIPHYQHRVNEWRDILEAVKTLDPAINYLEHIEHLELQMKYSQKELDKEAKKEFLDRYIS